MTTLIQRLQARELLAFFFILFFFSGCAHVISQETLKKTDPQITFKMLLSDPDAYKGKTVLFGGEIIQTTNTKDGAFIVVMQKPLDRYGVPTEEDISEGRFIIFHPVFLEPLIYSQKKEITVAGVVIGSKKMPVGEVEYTYPLISPIELKLKDPPKKEVMPDYWRLYPRPYTYYDPNWCRAYPYSEIYRQDRPCPLYPYLYPYPYPYWR